MINFCGFLVLHCPPRPESRDVLRALGSSGHTLQMITGDSLLTLHLASHLMHTMIFSESILCTTVIQQSSFTCGLRAAETYYHYNIIYTVTLLCNRIIKLFFD